MADETLKRWLDRVSAGPAVEQPTNLVDVFLMLHSQNQVMMRQNDEMIRLGKRAAKAAEATASHTFWIALPIWMSAAALSVAIGLAIVGMLVR